MAKALIIDDNEMNLESLRILLKKEDIEAFTLSSPADIAREVESIGHLDVVFLDLEFPNHDGISLFSSIKALPRLQNVPIIAYSVHISELNEVRAAGFDGFIGKPLDTQAFPDQIRRILAGEAIWDVGQ